MHFGKSYFETAKGQRQAWRKRQSAQVHLSLSHEPEGKGTFTAAKRIDVQREWSHQIALQGRKRAYTVPVVVQFDFVATKNDPPAIHNLPKNYLDLLQDCCSPDEIGRPSLLLKDDRQVRYLCCNYLLRPTGVGPQVGVHIGTMASLLADVELYERIRRNEFDEEVDPYSSRLHQIDKEEDRGDTAEAFSEALQDLRKWVDSEQRTVSSFGQAMYDAYRNMLQRDAQEKLLGHRRLVPRDFAMLYRGHVGKRSASPKSALDRSMGEWLKGLLMDYPFSFALAPPPVREGEGDAFKQSVRDALTNLREQPLLHPLLVPVGVTLLYLPPKNGLEVDLDNLARKVVPFFHEELRPPSDLVHALDIDGMPDGQAKQYSVAKREQLRRLPRQHIMSYQVLRVPRGPEDPTEGEVRLLIHAPQPFDGIWTAVEQTISEWSREVS